jgi:pSer/pThr/pTyr-binding forkhead associated (FHA) protein
MNDVTPGSVPSQASPQAKPNTPVVGFLYSISRKGIGEYWPLHLGTNTIGRSEDNDICLKEMSVSSKHATLSIKQMKSTHKLIASIRDTGSKTGMFLNDEELDYENHTCKANDIITVGSSYKLLLILIDAEEYGLSVAEGFVEDKQSTEDDFGFQPQGGFGDATQSKFRPYSADNRNVDTGTVDLSGAGFEEPGGTEMM